VILFDVIKSHKPDKFPARLTESRDYSHKLKVQFKATDFMANQIQQNLATFFQQKIIERLENQFDRLCDEMIKAIEN